MRLIADDLWTTIDGAYPTGLLDPATAFRPEGYFFTSAYRQGHTDGYVRFTKYCRHSKLYGFPTGLLDSVIKLLEEKEWRYELVDNRTFTAVQPCYKLKSADGSGADIDLSVGKYSFQSGALDAMLMEGRGIVKAGTGGGKTTIAAAAINSIGRRTCWLTHRKNLMYQTRDRLSAHLQRKIGILGDGEVDIQDITVCMMQTVSNVLKQPNLFIDSYRFLSDCEVVIGDEGHRLQGEQFYEAFAQIPARWRYLLTATPPNLDGEGMYLAAQTGKIIYEIAPTTLIQAGVLVPPRIWFIKYDSPKFPKAIPWQTVYAAGIVGNAERAEKTTIAAAQFASEKKPALTLVMRLNHGEDLMSRFRARNLRCAFVHGKVKDATRDQMFADLVGGALDNIVAQATTIGEGTDIPKLRAVINATGLKGGGDKSEGSTGKDTIQFLGRGLRATEGKTHLDYVDFIDTAHKSVQSASLARVRTLEAEGYGNFIKYYEDYIDDSVVVK